MAVIPTSKNPGPCQTCTHGKWNHHDGKNGCLSPQCRCKKFVPLDHEPITDAEVEFDENDHWRTPARGKPHAGKSERPPYRGGGWDTSHRVVVGVKVPREIKAALAAQAERWQREGFRNPRGYWQRWTPSSVAAHILEEKLGGAKASGVNPSRSPAASTTKAKPVRKARPKAAARKPARKPAKKPAKKAPKKKAARRR